MSVVAGIDSSTQSCEVVIRDAQTGAILRRGRAAHPVGTEVDPDHWWTAMDAAIAEAGGIRDAAAVSIAAQQHGMICLDDDGAPVRKAVLWNDVRSAEAATSLIEEFGGPAAWATAVGSVPVASFTVTKLRWLADHEPASARRTAAVCLPHDWLTWRLAGATGIDALTTDRGDASGTGYWSPASNAYRRDLLDHALGHAPELPEVLAPSQVAGETSAGVLVGAGTGDNMAAALALDLQPGDVAVSLGTSGTVSTTSAVPTADVTGHVAGFADATGAFLPLVCTLNAARVLDAVASLLGVDHDALDRLALSAPPGAGGLVVVPYLEGERTPNLPDATGAFHGLTLETAARDYLARAAVEGLLCSVADALDALGLLGISTERVWLIGGAARSLAVRRIAPTVLGRPVTVPHDSGLVAAGAARQAAWTVAGELPRWGSGPAESYAAPQASGVRERYAEARLLHLERR